MPLLRNRTVLEVMRGIKAFVNLEAGITRGAVPAPGWNARQKPRQGQQARVKDRNVDAPLGGAVLEAGEDDRGSADGADPYGLELKAGDQHYRAWVGPPGRYDLVTSIQVSLVLAAGLRETHRLADVGCGSLRAGRMLIPYLRPGHYFGVEPHRWVVEEGIERELGNDLVKIKRPSFRFVDDFSLDGFGVEFDVALAQSVFTHTYPDLTLTALRGIAKALAPEGKLLANFMEKEDAAEPTGSGWLYPGAVPYTYGHMHRLIEESGMVARPLEWMGQSWFVAGLPSAEQSIEALVQRLRSPIHR